MLQPLKRWCLKSVPKCCSDSYLAASGLTGENRYQGVPNFGWHLTAQSNTGWAQDLEEGGGDSKFYLIFVVCGPHGTGWPLAGI